MKKLLLSMAAVALSCTAAFAAEVELKMNNASNFEGKLIDETLKNDGSVQAAKHYEPIDAFEIDGYKFTAATNTGSSKVAFYFAPSTNPDADYTFRIYQANSFTVTAPEGVEMTSIVFTLNSTKNKDNFDPSVGTCEITDANKALEITWTGNASAVTFVPSGKGNMRITSLTVTTGTSDKETLQAPVFDPASGASFSEQLAVSISGPEGADIYYTLDGSNPTSASDKYEAPIVLTSTTTIKAFAVKEGMNDSGIATATYTKDQAYATLAELIVDGLDDETTELTYTGKATVTYVNGSNMYIKDETAALLIYGNLNTTYTQGDVITGFKGTFLNYFGTYELKAKADSFGEPVETVDVAPLEMTVANLKAEDQNQYIILRKVTVDAEALTLSQGSDVVPMYNKFKIDIPAGNVEKDVVGLISYYKDKGQDAPSIQIYPIAFQEPSAVNAIESETADAEYYSINGVRVNNANLQPGIYVVRANGRAHKVIVK